MNKKNQDYQIKLEVFEGPLDLLLYLVEKDEVDIMCIKVARVCKQFLEYLDLIKELSIEIAGEYLVMAATLTRLKARELLPQEKQQEAAEEGEIVSREQLIEQLIQYKKFKQAGIALKKLEDEQKGTYYRTKAEEIEWAEKFEEQVFDVTAFDLLTAFKNILDRTEEDKSHQVIRENVTIDDRIEHVLSYIYDNPQAKFEDLFKEMNTKITIVVTFMAILELIKIEQITIKQECQFGQIWVYRKDTKENTEIINKETINIE